MVASAPPGRSMSPYQTVRPNDRPLPTCRRAGLSERASTVSPVANGHAATKTMRARCSVIRDPSGPGTNPACTFVNCGSWSPGMFERKPIVRLSSLVPGASGLAERIHRQAVAQRGKGPPRGGSRDRRRPDPGNTKSWLSPCRRALLARSGARSSTFRLRCRGPSRGSRTPPGRRRPRPMPRSRDRVGDSSSS